MAAHFYLTPPSFESIEQMNIVRNLLFVAIVLPVLCLAANKTREIDEELQNIITGKTADGSSITAETTPPILVQVSTPDDSDTVTFKNESCRQSYVKDPLDKGKRIYTFSCDATAKSPLARTTYVSRYVKGDCIRGELAYHLYTCVAGCKQNKRAPRKLIQHYRDCAESLSASIKETQRLLPGASPKTIPFKIARRVEKELGSACVASENPSDSLPGGIRSGFETNLAPFGPADDIANALRVNHGIIATGTTQATVSTPPRHGRVKKIKTISADPARTHLHVHYDYFKYTPAKHFHGSDSVTFEVAVGGQIFRVSYKIRVGAHVQTACD